jgi:hypothetical protein
MKSKMLFFGLLLSFLMSNAVHSTDYQIDKFNLDLHAGRVASYLWQGAKVPAEEIDKVCNSVIRTARNSDASTEAVASISRNPEAITDERYTVETDTAPSEISTAISDFLEFTKDVAKERGLKKRLDSKPLESSLELFVDQVTTYQHDPYILRMVFDAVAEAYC